MCACVRPVPLALHRLRAIEGTGDKRAVRTIRCNAVSGVGEVPPRLHDPVHVTRRCHAHDKRVARAMARQDLPPKDCGAAKRTSDERAATNHIGHDATAVVLFCAAIVLRPVDLTRRYVHYKYVSVIALRRWRRWARRWWWIGRDRRGRRGRGVWIHGGRRSWRGSRLEVKHLRWRWHRRRWLRRRHVW